jgi:hypothetical protein
MKADKLIGKILGGSFLGDERVIKALPFFVYITVLGLISIKCSHSADKKVVEINRLTQKMKELEAEHIETKSKLMQLSMESLVVEKAKQLGLEEAEQPPGKILIKDE